MTAFLRTTLFLTLALCCSGAVFNYAVDSYSIYHYRSATTDQLSRVEQFYHMRLSKPWQVAQLKPNAVIVGTSRSGSMRPTHPSWSEHTAYNLSIPGMTPYELLRFIQHAQANGPLDKLMIGLDFEAFIITEPQTRKGFSEYRLQPDTGPVASLQSRLQFTKDVGSTLFSFPALAQNLAANTGTATPGRRFFPDGSWEKISTILNGKAGYIWVGNSLHSRMRETRHKQREDLNSNMSVLAEILRYCHQQGIDTRLFITPEHAFFLTLWQRLDYGESWEDFHRELVTVNEDIARTQGKAAFPLWGFNQLASAVTEPILPGAKNQESNFLDGIHFRNRLASTIMNSVWGEARTAGTMLDKRNLDEYLTEVRQLTQNFRKTNPQLYEKMHGAINSPE